MTRALGNALKATAEKAAAIRTSTGALGALQINRTDPCDFGGTTTLAGNLNDSTALGSLNVTFSNCRLGAATLNGQMQMRIDGFDLVNVIPTDILFSFSSLVMTGTGIDATSGGTIRLQVTQLGNIDMTANMVTVDRIRSTTSKLENFIVFTSLMNDPAFITQLLGGRVYDSVLGYIDVTTQTSLTSPIAPSDSHVYPISGSMTLTGAAAKTIYLTALSASQVKLELDQDGNGSRDMAATMQWTDLTGPIGSDIADTDGDGMPNGWEVHYGLNKLSSGDAALDLDGDLAPNLSEYLAGTLPNNPNSHPPLADLGVSISRSPSVVVAPTQVTYTVTATNFSSGPVTAFNVGSTLPASVSLVSMFPSHAATCDNFVSGANRVISCTFFGTTAAGASESLFITVGVAAAGDLSITATTRSNEVDPNPADNSAVDTTTVQ